ncbi:hypothetical protein AOCH_002521 [Aspergillus ochraceoroseus]|uniref:F-box domain-containing protein n=1 Tax=Aspergillus ochraceoroseus TaxID=138278 RepID=A0A0F8WQI2_9EURO|nr:hypothetical protein AOCH_002521 [Aspergillus ochraceoroseus]
MTVPIENQLPSMSPDQVSIETKKPDESPPIDAFGDEEFAEVKYKVLKWWQCGILMVAETISLGVLSLPAAVAGLGLVPALILLIGLGILATYTGYVIGQFKWRFPQVCSMADAGEVLMGRFGRELLGMAQLLFLVFIMASHLLTFTMAMNTITDHGTCSIVFGIVGLVISCAFSAGRTLDKMSWLSIASFASIFVALIITMIAVGVENRGTPPQAFVATNLVTGFTSAANIVFSYASHSTFFNMIAELKTPRDFPKALTVLQCIDISLYVVAAVVIYWYTGGDAASPALGSAGPLVSRIAYGVALPTIIIAGVINGHVASKSIYLRLFAGTDHMHKRNWIATGSWIGIAFALWGLAWIISSAIPVFSDLLSLITALFGSWFTFGLPGIFWLYINRGLWFSSYRKLLLTILNIACICIGVILRESRLLSAAFFAVSLIGRGLSNQDEPSSSDDPVMAEHRKDVSIASNFRLSSFPNEILLAIAEHLNTDQDLNALVRVCRQFYILLNYNLYQNHLKRGGSQGLLWAAAHGRERTVRLFLEHGADLEYKSEKTGENAFILAAKSGHVSILNLLIAQGVDVTVKENGEQTALDWAIIKGHAEVVSIILALNKLDINGNNAASETPLQLAADRGCKEIVEMLLESKQINVDQESRNRSPLVRAGEKGHFDVVKILVDHGSNLDYFDLSNCTAMHHAARQGNEAFLDLLLSLGASPDVFSGGCSTPLICAVEGDHLGIVKKLLTRDDVDLNQKTPYYQFASLTIAAQYGKVEIVKCLLASGRVDVNSQTLQKQTALWQACREGRTEVVKLLFADPAINPNIPDGAGETPLLSAIRWKQLSVLDLFFERDDVDWQSSNKKGETPLLLAVSKGMNPIVEKLIAKGARIDCPDSFGRTPLLWAKWNRDRAMEAILLAYAKRCDYRPCMSIRERINMLEGLTESSILMKAAQVQQ